MKLFCAFFFYLQELVSLDGVPQSGNDISFLFFDVNGFGFFRRHCAPSLRAGGTNQNLQSRLY